MRETSVIDIDLSAVHENVAAIRRLIGPGCALCAVVKADAYGLGAPRIARHLRQAGADMLAVYTLEQAAELFRSAVGGPVLVLMPVREIERADDVYRGLVCGRLHLTVHDPGHLDDLVRLTDQYAVALPVHLEVDTGMSRGGCCVADAPAMLARIAASRRLRLAGIFTHFAAPESDPALTAAQAGAFDALLDDHRALVPGDCVVHVANTAATLRDPGWHRTMVRVGQGWAGYGSEHLSGATALDGAATLRPCLTWTSSIVQVRTIPKGSTVGYGATWRAQRETRIGLVPVGYSDGFPYALGRPTSRSRSGSKTVSSPGGSGPAIAVCVDTPEGPRRAYAPVVGRVNMDQITVDLTRLGGRSRTLERLVRPGTPVELISPDRSAPNHLVTLADAAGTVPYDLLCRLDPRIRRVYHGPGRAIDRGTDGAGAPRASATIEVLPATPAVAS